MGGDRALQLETRFGETLGFTDWECEKVSIDETRFKNKFRRRARMHSNRMACGIARVARANPGIRGDFAPRDANYEIDVMGSSRAASARRDPADRAGSFTALAIDPSSLSWRMLSQISPL
jgi:hypothetical protein